MSYNTAQPTNVTMTYDKALRPVTYEANSAANSAAIQKASYVYNPDGLLKEIAHDTVDQAYDQENKYDFVGRLKLNAMGDGYTNPYVQTLGYNAFSNLTSRATQTYNLSGRSFSMSYHNNRTNSLHTRHDAMGNVIKTESGYVDPRHDLFTEYDAAGRQWRWDEETGPGGAAPISEELTFDGDGRGVKRVKTEYSSPCCGVWTDYFIYSSVTGQKINDLLYDGERLATHVYMGGTVIAEEYDITVFQLTDPVSGSTIGGEHGRNELAALGTSVPETEPPAIPVQNYRKGGYAWNAESGCQINYGPVSCSTMVAFIRALGGTVMGGEIFSVWRYRKFKILDDDDSLEGEGDDNTVLVDQWYEVHSTPIPALSSGEGDGRSGCLFKFGFVASRTNTPTSASTGASALQAARDEIERILAEAGHRVTFDPNATADASYLVTLQGGESGDSWASGSLGTGVGSLWTGFLSKKATKVGFSATGAKAIGLAMGRIIAHEAVTHNFLSRDNKQHTKTGLTQKEFVPKLLFDSKESKNFRIPIMQNIELNQLCRPPAIPDNVV